MEKSRVDLYRKILKIICADTVKYNSYCIGSDAYKKHIKGDLFLTPDYNFSQELWIFIPGTPLKRKKDPVEHQSLILFKDPKSGKVTPLNVDKLLSKSKR